MANALLQRVPITDQCSAPSKFQWPRPGEETDFFQVAAKPRALPAKGALSWGVPFGSRRACST
eukprot:2200097-Pyramimonas_sp.AAC.1